MLKWITRLFLGLLFGFIALCVAAFYVLEPEISKGSDHPRPSSIPTTAVWSGGIDGGVYVDIKAYDPQTGTLTADIYHDYAGDLAYSGAFSYQGDTPPPHISHEDIAGWDGDILLIVHGGYFATPSSEVR